MATLDWYKGLRVVSPDPTGEGGLAIQNDFKQLVDWHPKSVWAQSGDPPNQNNDESEGYYPGSLWLKTDVTPPQLYVCKTSTDGAAVWQQVMTQIKVVQDTAPQLGGNLDVNGKSINAASGNVVLQTGGTPRVTLKGSTSEVFIGTTTTMPNRGLPLAIEGATPGYAIFETDGPDQERAWDFYAHNGSLIFRCVNNAISNATTWLQLDRTGQTPTLLSLNVTTQITGLTKLIGPLYHQQTYCDNKVGSDADGTVTFDLAQSDMHYAVLSGGNRTLALSNVHAGQRFNVTLKQDGVGNRSVTWWNGISWPGGTTPSLTPTANKSDIFEFLCTSSSVFVGRVWGQNY